MNPLIITAFTIGGAIGAIAGFFTCAWLTAGKVAELQEEARLWQINWQDENHLYGEACEAHSRVFDAMTTKNERINRALEQERLTSNATVKRMAAILRGER